MSSHVQEITPCAEELEHCSLEMSTYTEEESSCPEETSICEEDVSISEDISTFSEGVLICNDEVSICAEVLRCSEVSKCAEVSTCEKVAECDEVSICAEEIPMYSEEMSTCMEETDFYPVIVKTESLSGLAANGFEESSESHEHMVIQLDPNEIYGTDDMCDNDNEDIEILDNGLARTEFLRAAIADPLHQCSECGVEYVTGEELKFHVKIIHDKTFTTTNGRVPKARKSYCKECDYSTYDYHQLKEHLNTHCRDIPLQCDRCEFQSLYYSVMSKHKELHLSAVICQCNNVSSHKQTLHCELCMFFTVCPESLKTHHTWHAKRIRNTHGPAVTSYDQRHKNLKCHEHNGEACHLPSESNHTGCKMGKLFSCEECNYTTTDGAQLKTHNIEHYKRKRIKCEDCPFACDVKSFMTKHKRLHLSANICQCLGPPSHGEYIYCNECMFFTICPTSLKSHESWHSQIKQFRCNSCPFTTNYARNLKKHVDTHHNRSTSSTDLLRNVKPFICQLCNFSAPANYLLKLHVETSHWYMPPTESTNARTKNKRVVAKPGLEGPIISITSARTINVKPCHVLLERLPDSCLTDVPRS